MLVSIARGERLFELTCERDLEGIVAKWAYGSYQTAGHGTSWLKIKIRMTARRKAGTSRSTPDVGHRYHLARRGNPLRPR